MTTIHGKILSGEKLVNLANCELFTKNFLADIYRHTENVTGFTKTDLNCTIGNSRINNLKH